MWDIVILAVLMYGNVLLWGNLGVGWDDVGSVIAEARIAAVSIAQDVASFALPHASPTPSVGPAATAAPSVASTDSVSPTKSVLSVSLRDFKNGPWLEQQNPRLAFAIKGLGWIGDGIDGTEAEVIQDLLYIAFVSLPVTASLVSLGWVQDGIDEVEAGAFRWLSNMNAAEVVESVVALGWVQDGIDNIELKTIENLSYIAYEDSVVAASVISQSWVRDGIDDVESGAIRWLTNIKAVEVASSVLSLSWVQDGIDDVEVQGIENLSYIAYGDTAVASSILSLGWIQDGIAEAEIDLIESLAALARDTEAALWIVDMPFLASIEPPDIAAAMSLRRLAALEPEAFARLMSHPALRDGISNDTAHIVATLYGVARTNSDLIDVLLDPARVSLEQRTVTLPLAGEVVLTIIRTGPPGVEKSMELLERSVRRAEEYMDAPLPTNYVGLLYENAVVGDVAGTNFGTHFAILSKYDVDDGGHEAAYASHISAHEVAHYYWSGNEDWVDEGAAEFMALVIDGARLDRPMGVARYPCAYADSIADLKNLDIERGDIEFSCNYALGERLFADLHRALGNEKFREGFRALYSASEMEDDADERRGTSVGIDHIRAAFRSEDGAESSVIARWYDGTKPYDLSRLDASPADPRLPSIKGRIEEAYISTEKDGPPVSGFAVQDVTDRVSLVLKYSYNVSGGSHSIPLEIVEYYKDGFEYRRRSGELTAEAKYIGGTRWYSVGPPPAQRWAPGRYWVYVYAGERKLAEVPFEVTF